MTHLPDGRQMSSNFRLPSAGASTPLIADQTHSDTDQTIDGQGFNATRHYKHNSDTVHYRVTKDEWLLAWDELKPAEIKVLYYLRTLDPWGDKNLEVSVTDLAKTLNCNKGTVSRALKILNRNGWIDLEITTATVKLHTKNSTDNTLSIGNPVVSGSQVLSPDNSDDRQTTPLIATQHLASETQTEQGARIPLNSLKLNRLTTHLDGECGVSVSMNQEPAPDIDVPIQLKANSEKLKPVCEPAAVEKDITIAPSILQPAKKLGVNIEDRLLLQAVKQWPDQVEDAISALEEKANRVQSPTRFLVRAIKGGWQPETPRTNKAPEGFGAWFREGRSRYLMVASQRMDGVHKILMACDQWIPYDLLQSLSWEEIALRFGPKEAGYAIQ